MKKKKKDWSKENDIFLGEYEFKHDESMADEFVYNLLRHRIARNNSKKGGRSK